MFGAICAGRLVQTNLEQIDQTKFVFSLQDAASINHITVFLLPEIPFPDGYGATVFFSWPGRPFQLLGGLSNAKPSAIFRLGGTHNTSNEQVTASLGISIEPLVSVDAQVSRIPKNVTTSTSNAIAVAPPSIATVTTRVVKNLYNFLTSYAVDASQISPTEQFVPLRVC